VNDRFDVALAAGAAGVHLGENSLPVSVVAQSRGFSAPPNFLMGVSCHAKEAAVQAARDGASYLFFGPVFATPSKAAFGAPQGLARLREVCSAVNIPVLAIGGITVENAVDCCAAGAAGVAGIRLFQEAGNMAAVVAKIHQGAL
jgi:thiamine-phosphate pyrophosphorylase